ncbi:MAG: hypothetical protein IJE89_03315 [Bacilli bacterium]|nr:hypothetical protein [Bacilli bacterium]
MVLRVTYDKSLWFILKNDKKNRNRILSFFKNFPSNLYQQLLNEMRNRRIINEYNEEVIDGILYYYEFNRSDGSICIGNCYKDNCEENDIFLIKLYPFRSVDTNGKNISLGSIIYQNKEVYRDYIYDCGKLEYCLTKKSDRVYFVTYNEYGVLVKKRNKKVNILEVPSTVNFASFDKKNNHVLRRKINGTVIPHKQY